ncbi:MAG TPA: hypothetical protein VMW24_22115 [Sedimentisphaerales bacterium]|nr:hypothetical protein [Sedimentisphaerales bacterium]
MNDNIEAQFTQMFAPQPIPQIVKEAYKRVKFYADRNGLPEVVRPMDLVLLAVAATTNSISEALPAVKAPLPLVIDTSEDEIDETESVQPEAVSDPPQAIGGIMDAPATPGQEKGAKKDLQLQSMSATELQAHLRDCYQHNVYLGLGKAKMIHLIGVLDQKRAMR